MLIFFNYQSLDQILNLFCATVTSPKADTTAAASKQPMRNWETLVLFAVNLSRLDVMVNMSNVMGNTV